MKVRLKSEVRISWIKNGMVIMVKGDPAADGRNPAPPGMYKVNFTKKHFFLVHHRKERVSLVIWHTKQGVYRFLDFFWLSVDQAVAILSATNRLSQMHWI